MGLEVRAGECVRRGEGERRGRERPPPPLGGGTSLTNEK